MTDSVKSRHSYFLVLVIAGLCVYLCIALILHVQYLIFLTKLSQGTLIEPAYPRAVIIGTLLQRIAILISFAAIYWGIRRMRITGKSILHTFVAIIGIGMCISYFMLNFYENSKVHQIYTGVFDAQIIQRLEKKLLKNDLPSKNRAFIEKALAKEIYLDQNHLISIADENGSHSLFKPTDDDIKYKRLRNVLKDAFSRDEMSTRNRMVMWLVILLLGVCFGRFMPVRKANEPTA
jgi:hypothetical protein